MCSFGKLRFIATVDMNVRLIKARYFLKSVREVLFTLNATKQILNDQTLVQDSYLSFMCCMNLFYLLMWDL